MSTEDIFFQREFGRDNLLSNFSLRYGQESKKVFQSEAKSGRKETLSHYRNYGGLIVGENSAIYLQRFSFLFMRFCSFLQRIWNREKTQRSKGWLMWKECATTLIRLILGTCIGDDAWSNVTGMSVEQKDN
jgi:hypothetical protein